MRFIPDIWSEIFETISKNKARTILTGIAIAWGIFIFVILLGIGNSLKNGIKEQFEGDAVNTISVSGGRTSKEYKGFSPGRRIQLQNKDASLLRGYFNNVEDVAVKSWLNKRVRYKTEIGDYRIMAVTTKMQEMDRVEAERGRLINEVDHKEKRKVIVLGTKVYEQLLKTEDGKIGEKIFIDNLPFTFIGVFKDKNPWNNNSVYIPISTAQILFGQGENVDNVVLMTNASIKETNIMVEKIKSLFSRLYNFDMKDPRALWINNTVEEYGRTMSVLVGIKWFVAIIGLLTLISGITGISNIMFIVVKERTREIGIRKALGAKPNSIVKMILLEAVFITTIAGYIGLVSGAAVLELLNYLLVKFSTEDNPLSMFSNPSVNVSMAILATLILILCGTLAGYFPARKASKIKPIEALRYEN